ncbi:MAG: DUF2325 domain-containing protein [Thermodesulfobacteriota bacterium]
MCVALIGGMERSRGRYVDEARKLGVDLKVYNTAPNRMVERLAHVDGIVVLTNRVSHEAKRMAVTAAKTRRIPVLHCHACGVCSVRECLSSLKGGARHAARRRNDQRR